MAAINIPLNPPRVLDATSRENPPEAAHKLATDVFTVDQRFPRADETAMAVLVMLTDERVRRARDDLSGATTDTDDPVNAIEPEAAVAAYQYACGDRNRAAIPTSIYCDVLKATGGSVALTTWNDGLVRICRPRQSTTEVTVGDAGLWESESAAVGEVFTDGGPNVGAQQEDTREDDDCESPRGPYLAVTHHSDYAHDLGEQWRITAEWLTRKDIETHLARCKPDFIATQRCFSTETLRAINGASPTTVCERIVRDERRRQEPHRPSIFAGAGKL